MHNFPKQMGKYTERIYGMLVSRVHLCLNFFFQTINYETLHVQKTSLQKSENLLNF